MGALWEDPVLRIDCLCGDPFQGVWKTGPSSSVLIQFSAQGLKNH